jgi:hypothetical protein
LKSLDNLNEKSPKSVSRCPTKCNYESLTVWIGLFGVFVGLTIASVIFVVAFVLLSKLQIHKFDKQNNTTNFKLNNPTSGANK